MRTSMCAEIVASTSSGGCQPGQPANDSLHVRLCFSSARPRMTHRGECSHLRHLFLFPHSSHVRTHVHAYVVVHAYVRTYGVLLILQVAPGVPGAPGSPPACSAMRSIGACGKRVPRPRGSTAVSAQGALGIAFQDAYPAREASGRPPATRYHHCTPPAPAQSGRHHWLDQSDPGEEVELVQDDGGGVYWLEGYIVFVYAQEEEVRQSERNHR